MALVIEGAEAGVAELAILKTQCGIMVSNEAQNLVEFHCKAAHLRPLDWSKSKIW